MNERIKELRTVLGLSAEKFGSRVGVTRSAISRIENCVVNVTEQMILSVCREFNVREEWLRNGSGDMFLDFTEDEFSKAVSALSNDSFVRSLIVEYLKLDEDNRNLFKDFIHRLSDKMQSYESVQTDTHSDSKPSTSPPSLSIEEKVEQYRKELELEEKVKGESKALQNGA